MENVISKPSVILTYNGKNCTEDFSKYLQSITFNEFEDSQSDELNIALTDDDYYFLNEWYPEKGDKLTCTVEFDNETYDFGSFTIDENSFNISTEGTTLEIKALASSTNHSIRSNKTVNHTGKTLIEIARQIGKKYGYRVAGSIGFVKIGAVVQKDETDIAFLKRISREYGYIFNIKDNVLTFTKMEELLTNEPIFNLFPNDIKSISLTDTVAKMYGKCTVQYLDLKTKSLKSYTAIGNDKISDILTLTKKCASLDEAKAVASAALKNGRGEITGRIETKMPDKAFMAGINFSLSDEFGKFAGIYHIKSAETKINEHGMIQTGGIVKC